MERPAFPPEPLVRTKTHEPLSFFPCRVNFNSPLRNAASTSSCFGSHIPTSHSMTVPPPYSPFGMTPSNFAYSIGWSSVAIGNRLMWGSSEGPWELPRRGALRSTRAGNLREAETRDVSEPHRRGERLVYASRSDASPNCLDSGADRLRGSLNLLPESASSSQFPSPKNSDLPRACAVVSGSSPLTCVNGT
jgi:hypothetical protein